MYPNLPVYSQGSGVGYDNFDVAEASDFWIDGSGDGLPVCIHALASAEIKSKIFENLVSNANLRPRKVVQPICPSSNTLANAQTGLSSTNVWYPINATFCPTELSVAAIGKAKIRRKLGTSL